MANYTLETELINKFDMGKCNKRTKKKNGKNVILHNNCPSSFDYAKFIGSIIAHRYKKDNKQDQSIWNTDVARYSYIIKLLENNTSGWKQDRKGIKTQTQIVAPLIVCISDLLKEHYNYVRTNLFNLMKNYIIAIQKDRIYQMQRYKEYKINGKKNKSNKKRTVLEEDDMNEFIDVNSLYDFENFDTNKINSTMSEDDLAELSSITISCSLYNSKHKYYNFIGRYQNANDVLTNLMMKIKNIRWHIEDINFGSAVVRAMCGDFCLDIGNQINLSNEILIEDITTN